MICLEMGAWKFVLSDTVFFNDSQNCVPGSAGVIFGKYLEAIEGSIDGVICFEYRIQFRYSQQALNSIG